MRRMVTDSSATNSERHSSAADVPPDVSSELSLDGGSHGGGGTRIRPFVMWIIQTAGLVIVMLVIVACSMALWFGSLKNSILYLQDTRLVVHPTLVTLEPGKVYDVKNATISVQNISTGPITILGATESCDCLSTAMLPLTVRGRATAELLLRAILSPSNISADGTYNQTVVFYTDSPVQPRFRVTVSATVADAGNVGTQLDPVATNSR